MKEVLTRAMIVTLAGLAGCAEPAPYPKSDIIAGIEWDFASYERAGIGSDLWYTTWCSDNHLYSAWGDGCGFGTCFEWGPFRASMGVSRIEGTPPNWNARNVWGGLNPLSDQDTVLGKPSGILCVDDMIYVFAKKQDTWDKLRIIFSRDLGETWEVGNFDFQSPLDVLSPIQFGRNYAGGPAHVYFYFVLDGYLDSSNKALGLARVPKDSIEKRSAYEFFTGINRRGALWSKDIADRKAVFADVDAIVRSRIAAMYHPGLDRYFITTQHNDNAGWGLYEASNPWGPWKTISYYENCWKDCHMKFTWILTQKWLSLDGRHFWVIFSGHPEYDSYNHLKGAFKFGRVAPRGQARAARRAILRRHHRPCGQRSRTVARGVPQARELPPRHYDHVRIDSRNGLPLIMIKAGSNNAT
jgi:hypothetical protein